MNFTVKGADLARNYRYCNILTSKECYCKTDLLIVVCDIKNNYFVLGNNRHVEIVN